MTLIAIHDVWISADMTENNLGNIDPGDQTAIVLDVMPGRVLKGRIRSVGGGVGTGQSAPPGTLPTVENNRDWLRQAQRIPVAVEFDAGGPGAAPRRPRWRTGRSAGLHGRPSGDEPVRSDLHPGHELAVLPLLSTRHGTRGQGCAPPDRRSRRRRAGGVRIRAADAVRRVRDGSDRAQQARAPDATRQGRRDRCGAGCGC